MRTIRILCAHGTKNDEHYLIACPSTQRAAAKRAMHDFWLLNCELDFDASDFQTMCDTIDGRLKAMA